MPEWKKKIGARRMQALAGDGSDELDSIYVLRENLIFFLTRENVSREYGTSTIVCSMHVVVVILLELLKLFCAA